MATATPPASAGFLSSLRSLGDGLWAGAQQRIELLTVEFQEEKVRLIQTIVWISAVTFAGMLALVFASLTLVYLFWASARLAVLGGLTVFYTAALVAIVFAFRRFLARQTPPFAATLQELGEDRACMQTGI